MVGSFAMEDEDDEDQDNGEWRNAGPAGALQNFIPRTTTNPTRLAKEMRECLADYFMTVGSVPFQLERAPFNSY